MFPKSLLVIVSIILLLGGCQTAGNSVGVGAITLSKKVTNYYENKYLKSPGPQYFVVSADGRFSRYVFCSAGPGQCTSGLLVLEVIEKCADRARQQCYIFDEGSHIVWDGPVFFAGQPASNRNEKIDFESALKVFEGKPNRVENMTWMSNWNVCGWAISPASSPPQWRSTAENLPFVQQARIRGLSLQFCSEYLEAGTVGGLSDATLCNYSLGTYGDNPAWVATGRFSNYFHEAQRRGFTPKTCMSTVVKSGQAIRSAEKIDPTNIENRRGFLLTNKKLCAPALDIEQGEAQWSKYYAYLGYTYEALYRGLTPSDCQQATKAGDAVNNVTRNIETYSDAELCNLSVVLPDGKPIWSEHEDDQEYVSAAKAKGLAPSDCISSPYVS